MISILLLIFVALFSGFISLKFKKKLSPYISSLLSFSGAYLLSICFLHLLPELFEESEMNLGIYILIGFFLQLTLDYFSGGIEHGHTHVNQKKVGQFPWFIFFSLCIHAFLESIPIDHVDHDAKIGSYLAGLLIHKGPIAFILASLLAAYKLPQRSIVLGIITFSLSAPLGYYFGAELGSGSDIYQKLLALSIGIILHLSTTILLETNEEHKIHWKKVSPMLLGAILGLFSLLIH
jgi:hypothetical protein